MMEYRLRLIQLVSEVLGLDGEPLVSVVKDILK